MSLMPVRFTIAIVAGLIITACGAESLLPISPTSVPQPGCGDAAWWADHETGDLSQWYVGGNAGESNSGNAVSVASTDFAHSGRYSVKATITAPPLSGVRLSRSKADQIPQEAYFSAWYYFPRIYTPNSGHWNLFQFKSSADGGSPDPFWYLEADNRSNGNMYLYLTWWNGLCPLGVEGPHAGECGGKEYRQTIKDLPVGQWVHIEVYQRQSSGYTGQIIVWQDGVELFNQNNVKTRYPFEGNRWSLDNYSGSLSPSPSTIYIDDAVIRTACIGSTPGAVSPVEP